MYNKKIELLLLGFISIITGGLIIYHPKYYSSRFGRYFDFTGIEWPFGGALIIVGGLLIWSSVKKRKGGGYYLICPSCRNPYHKKDVPSMRCPDCDVGLEDLYGFYERYPNLKEK